MKKGKSRSMYRFAGEEVRLKSGKTAYLWSRYDPSKRLVLHSLRTQARGKGTQIIRSVPVRLDLSMEALSRMCKRKPFKFVVLVGMADSSLPIMIVDDDGLPKVSYVS